MVVELLVEVDSVFFNVMVVELSVIVVISSIADDEVACTPSNLRNQRIVENSK